MPINNGLIAVGTAATLISHAGVNPGQVHISNLDNTDTIFVGNATVVVNTGHYRKAHPKTSIFIQVKASMQYQPKPVTQ